MSELPRKCVVDTNVPKTANMATDPLKIVDELTHCVLACVKAIEHVIEKGGLVLDAGDEIFTEYRHQLSMKGQPGVGDQFLKWVHDNRWKFPSVDRVTITKNEQSYNEFPNHQELNAFDPADRKFVAVANAHPEKPPILQATDSKWWGWKDALANVGIFVQFICPLYIETKYNARMVHE